jgi:parallel beta-helix repeat protein
MTPALLAAALFLATPAPPEVLLLTSDNTTVDRSVLIRVPAGVVIPDTDGNGVLHVAADHITIEFEEGSVLRGTPEGTPWDALQGVGIRIEGRKGVTIRNAAVHGFKVGILATAADHLTIDRADLSDNFRQRLGSTPQAEDPGDWLWPHRNDAREWMTSYGAALGVERSSGVTIRQVRVRRGQNGIVLDRVTDSRIYDNDCSFLSGWGLAMWRCERNLVSRNAFDFCVRGHVEGVYNRGQDSAGILAFEQCSNNVFVENSATHSGDGFFGFAGREALGEADTSAGLDLKRRGCNDNLFLDNDFSYAPAHGIEMTFSFGNVFARNRIVQNAICGFWLGYSQDSLIAENHIEGNGGMGYGLERGGVNIEHGSGNRILRNTFLNNKAAVHLWWDRDDLPAKPWGLANYRGVTGNIIAGNTIRIDAGHPFRLRPGERLVGLHLRDDSGGHLIDTIYAANTVDIGEAREIDAPDSIRIVREGSVPAYELPSIEPIGHARPVGARAALAGRDRIILDEWGPWDHASLMLRKGRRDGNRLTFEVFGAAGAAGMRSGRDRYKASFPGASGDTLDVVITMSPQIDVRLEPGSPHVLAITAPAGAWPWSLEATLGARTIRHAGTLVAANWDVTVFPWTDDADPRQNLEAWRALARSDKARQVRRPALDFRFGSGGPSTLGWADHIRAADIPNDRFGLIASTTLTLPAGKWRITTLSDDGVRVRIADRILVDNWTWHPPTRDSAEFSTDGSPVEIVVEYFEIDGHAVLTLDLEKID